MKSKIKHALLAVITAIAMVSTLVIPGGIRSSKADTNSVSTYDELSSAISNALNGDTIEVTSDIIVTAQLTINKTLTINGNGHTISVPVPGFDDSGVYNTSPSAFRVFNVTSGIVSINDVVVKGGTASPYGSGIYVASGATLHLEGVTVSNCGGASYPGGGICNYGGTVFLKECNIVRNGARYGGGFLNLSGGKMFVENCSFSENRSLSATGGGGAGENQAFLYINNSTFSNNKSTELGGAINNYNGTAYILNSTFSGNVNISGSYSGGAMRSSGFLSAIYLVNDIFAYNYTSTNGNSYFLNDFDPSFWSGVTAYNCLFHGSTFVSGGSNTGTNITQYSGSAAGDNDTIFTGGSTSQVLAADGTLYGTATIYQPYLARVAGSITTSVPLQPGSTALNAGIPTAFTNGSGTPVIGYYSGGAWTELTNTFASADALASYRASSDQNNAGRADPPAIGAVETTVSSLSMVKINKVTGGKVAGGSVYGDTYADGASVTLTAIPDNGYQFKEWDNASGEQLSTGNPYTFTASSNVTITPVFQALAPGQYIITYVGNGNTSGSVPESSGTVLSAPATIAGNTGSLVKTGYVFTGWNTRANGSGVGYAAGSDYANGVNLTLYAQWAAAIKYTVTFDSQGGSGITSVEAIDGSTITAPEDPTKDGWDFDGWYKELTCKNAWNFAADTVTGNITLFAKWKMNSSATPPVVVQAPATPVKTDSGIQLFGEVTVTGSASVMERGFVYGTKKNPSVGGLGTTRLAAGSGTGSFSVTLTDLSADTVYYVRAYVITREGTFYGPETVIPLGAIGIPQTGDNGFALYGWLICGIVLTGIAALSIFGRRKETN